MKRAVIVSGARTPIGSFLGALSPIEATGLGAFAIEGALKRAHLEAKDVEEVIMGQVLQGGAGQAPARQAALGGGLLSSTPCSTINKVCGSGLKAVMMAEDAILLGRSQVVVAGGMESMSNAPYILQKARAGFRMGSHTVLDMMIHDGLFDPYGHSHMGSFGDMCAREYQFSREEQDNFAHESYRRANDAREKGWSKDEIVPVTVKIKGETNTVSIDEEPFRYKPEKLATLRPAFDADGTVTAANASKINDGAAALVIMGEDEAKKRGSSIKARILASASYAHAPQWFTTAPINAIREVLNRASLAAAAIDLFEINEAFSVVALAAMKELSLPHERVNIFGGAVALGHPIGCSGARVLITLLNALEKNDKRIGCVSICLGGGEALAMIVERV